MKYGEASMFKAKFKAKPKPTLRPRRPNEGSRDRDLLKWISICPSVTRAPYFGSISLGVVPPWLPAGNQN